METNIHQADVTARAGAASTARDDGGPAFPSSPTVGPSGDLYRPADIGCAGISVRDYFAAKVLEGTLAGPDSEGWFAWAPSADKDAAYCYFVADAMLRARAAK